MLARLYKVAETDVQPAELVVCMIGNVVVQLDVVRVFDHGFQRTQSAHRRGPTLLVRDLQLCLAQMELGVRVLGGVIFCSCRS